MEKEIKENTIIDEEGNEIKVNVLKTFSYKNKDYVVLYEDCNCEHDENECECDINVFIMEHLKEEGKEEFIEVNDDVLLDELIEIASKNIYQD